MAMYILDSDQFLSFADKAIELLIHAHEAVFGIFDQAPVG